LANKKGLVFAVVFAARKAFDIDIDFGIGYIPYHFDNLFLGYYVYSSYIHNMKIYCKLCNKVTKHRQKGLRTPVNVCNKCNTTNMSITLVKSNGEKHYASQVQFVEWSGEELGSRGKKLYDDPQIGFSCIMDPQYGYQYTWLTTPIVEIVSDTTSKNQRTIIFKTNNSEYTLYITFANIKRFNIKLK
jgi:hypothetical protein